MPGDARIVFADAAGTGTLYSGVAPVRRFGSWTPKPGVVSDSEVALGSQITYTLTLGVQRDVTFTLTHVPAALMPLVLRLIRHSQDGGNGMAGVFAVHTGDLLDRVYATCQVPKGAAITVELADKRQLLYTVAVTARNVAAGGGDFTCVYK